jgi:hypothetical protein
VEREGLQAFPHSIEVNCHVLVLLRRIDIA